MKAADPRARERRARAERIRWLEQRFEELGIDVPEHIRARGGGMTRAERRAALAEYRRLVVTPVRVVPHTAARPPGLSDEDWRAAKNAAKRERRERA